MRRSNSACGTFTSHVTSVSIGSMTSTNISAGTARCSSRDPRSSLRTNSGNPRRRNHASTARRSNSLFSCSRLASPIVSPTHPFG